MSALPELLADTEDRFQRDLEVIGAVAASPVLDASDAAVSGTVQALARDLAAIAHACSWSEVEVAGLIGCGTPDPESWKVEPLEVLESSRAVVAFLREQVDAATEPPLDRDARGAARESLYVSLEALSRSGYATTSATFALRHEFEGSSAASPIRLIRADRQGAARALVIKRINAWFARPGRPLPGVTVREASDHEQSPWTEGAEEPDLVGADYIATRLDAIRDRTKPTA